MKRHLRHLMQAMNTDENRQMRAFLEAAIDQINCFEEDVSRDVLRLLARHRKLADDLGLDLKAIKQATPAAAASLNAIEYAAATIIGPDDEDLSVDDEDIDDEAPDDPAEDADEYDDFGDDEYDDDDDE